MSSALNLALGAATGVYGLAPDRPSAPLAATPERPIPPRSTVCGHCWAGNCMGSTWRPRRDTSCTDDTCPCPCRTRPAPPCGAMYVCDSSPCTRPRGHLDDDLPHRCYDPYGRGHWIDFVPKPGGRRDEWVEVDRHEALKR